MLTGKVIAWEMADGTVQFPKPQIGARLVRAITFDDIEQTFAPPVPAYNALRPFGKDILSGAFTEANLTWGETEAAFLARCDARNRPQDAVSSTIMEASDTPRRKALFREAWKLNGAMVDVDMPKARIIKTDQVRAERDKRLVALDGEWFKAVEQAVLTGNKSALLASVAAKKPLRDLPATTQSDLDAIATPEVLEAYAPPWP